LNIILMICLSLTACSSTSQNQPTPAIQPLPPISTTNSSGLNVKSRITINLSGNAPITLSQNRSQKSIQLTSSLRRDLESSTTFSINESGFNQTITATGALTTLGTISINQLSDNNLVCNTLYYCLVGEIRAYIQGPYPGLYSAAANQSIPVYITTPQYSTQNVGLSSNQSIMLESYNIPSLTYALTQNNFSSNNGYTVLADFTQAAAGTFQGQLVLEYVLTGDGAPISPIISQKNSLSGGGQVTIGNNVIINSQVSGMGATQQKSSDGTIVLFTGVNGVTFNP
jgi:hypothetical protein